MVAPSFPTPPRRPRRGDVATAPRTAAVWDVVLSAPPARLADPTGRPLEVLDLGGGTGGMAVRLAALGHRVTVVDPSPDALAALPARRAERGRGRPRAGLQADADELHQPGRVGGRPGLCHGVLEHVDEPRGGAGGRRRGARPGGAVSLVVAQRRRRPGPSALRPVDRGPQRSTTRRRPVGRRRPPPPPLRPSRNARTRRQRPASPSPTSMACGCSATWSRRRWSTATRRAPRGSTSSGAPATTPTTALGQLSASLHVVAHGARQGLRGHQP